MAKKKRTSTNNVAWEPKKNPYIYNLKVGDAVIPIGDGNLKCNGTGSPVHTPQRLRWIGEIVGDMPYPFRIVNEQGTTIGYFNEKALKKM